MRFLNFPLFCGNQTPFSFPTKQEKGNERKCFPTKRHLRIERINLIVYPRFNS